MNAASWSYYKEKCYVFVCVLELTSYLATSLLCQRENKHRNYCYYCCCTLISLNICAI
jgi:hypothetical protein